MAVKPFVPHPKRPLNFLARLPYWLLAAILLAVLFLWQITADATYTIIFRAVVKGIGTTVTVTLIASVSRNVDSHGHHSSFHQAMTDLTGNLCFSYPGPNIYCGDLYRVDCHFAEPSES